jgi:hypothetical protein
MGDQWPVTKPEIEEYLRLQAWARAADTNAQFPISHNLALVILSRGWKSIS